MTRRISQSRLEHDLRGTSIDVEEAARHPDLEGVDVTSADLDGDGRIAGDDEDEALFRALDAVDRDGRARTIRSGPAVDAIAELSGSRALADDLRPPNDEVAYVGLNPGSRVEVAALRDHARVSSLGGTSEEEWTVQIGSRSFDLGTAAGIRGFVASLGLRGQTSERVARAIDRADRGGRDDLARIAAVWAAAERGGRIPSRLVLSGHASGTGVFGAGGQISAAALARLAEALPHATRQIEDLHVSACWSATEQKVAEWRSIFPHLRTLWGYEGAAPSGLGAARHLELWERATRGRAEELDPDVASRTIHGPSVAVWSVAHGWLGSEPPAPLEHIEGEWRHQRELLDRYFRGTVEVADPHRGPLRTAYSTLMRLLGRPELPAADRRALDADRARTVRLLYYGESVAPRFAAEHAPQIAAGYAALGLPAPAFGRLGRRQALEAIATFEARLARRAEPPAAAEVLRQLLAGLADLSPEAIPDTWI